jgi:hypothetical protein
MSFSSWLRNRTSAHALRGRPQGRDTAPRFRPHLEELEGRVVPSVLTVTNNNDHGGGSLRYEIAKAQNGDTVNFAPSLDGQTITLTTGELDIGTTKQPRSIQIEGPGDSQLAVSGGGVSRVFGVGSHSQLILSGLTITGGGIIGGGIEGGGISNEGTLTVSACTISNNSASDGGGIYNIGTLTVSGCTISNNSAIDNGGGIFNLGTLTVSGCTLSGNSAYYAGGGGICNRDTAMVTNSTLSGNNANSGGGIYNAYRATLTVSGCTVSDNQMAGIANDSDNLFGTLTVSNTTFSGNIAYDVFGNPVSDPIDGGYTDGGGNTFG